MDQPGLLKRDNLQENPRVGLTSQYCWSRIAPGRIAETLPQGARRLISNPTMTGSKFYRLFTILMLYVAQGIPIGLLEFAIPAWMASNGATGAEIGYMIGLASLPWAMKFINGALMDRYTYLPMGRRRAWLIGAQVVMVGVLLVCAFLAPGPRDYILLGAIAFTVYVAVVFQDVAADALAVDISLGSERGLTGGLMAGGQALGIGLSAAVAGTIIYFAGIETAFAVCAVTMAMVSAYLIWVRERTGEKRVPWSRGEAHPASLKVQPEGWLPLLKNAFKSLIRPNSLMWGLPLFLKGLGYGIMVIAVPLIAANYTGWNEAQLGSANAVAQFAAALASITLGGYLCARLGAKPFQIISLLAFATVLIVFALLEPRWVSGWMLTTIVIGWTVVYFMVSVPQAAISMSFCDPRTGATQFSIYMAVVNQGIAFAGFSYAFIEGFGGIPGVFVTLAACNIFAALVVAFVRMPQEREPEEGGAAAAFA